MAMNSNVKNPVVKMGADELRVLTAEVKETVANNANADAQKTDKSFSAADLWNIQKNRKTQSLSKRAMLSRRSTIV